MENEMVRLIREHLGDGYNYVYEGTINPLATVIFKMPKVSSNRRGINDIGWQADRQVAVFGTISKSPETTGLWQEIDDRDDINKTVSAVKITNMEDEICNIAIRILMF